MAYEPTNWKAGDTVTSAKLNKMEQGIASAGGANILVAHFIDSTEDGRPQAPSRAAGSATPAISGRLDVTLEEIENADFTIVKLTTDYGMGNAYIDHIYYDEDINGYVLTTSVSGLTFFAAHNDDYPTTDGPEEDEQIIPD